MRQTIGRPTVLLAFVLSCVFVLAATSGQPIVRDHREVPGDAAQWKIDGAEVDSLNFHRLYNTARRKHLAATNSGSLRWEDTNPGTGRVIFENCTRAGEVVYSSDRVAVRFGSRFLIHASNAAGLDWTGDRAEACQFRLVSSKAGFVPAGSGDGTFAIYSIPANRYLVYQPSAWPLGIAALSLRWRETASGKPPRDVGAHADFVPVELFFTEGTFGDQIVQAVYLTIKNIGSVRSSASQQELTVTIRGEQAKFLIVTPLAPGATLTNPVRLNARLKQCEPVVVELDTNPRLKFQVGVAAFPTDAVFANDKATFTVRQRGRPETGPRAGAGTRFECGPDRIVR